MSRYFIFGGRTKNSKKLFIAIEKSLSMNVQIYIMHMYEGLMFEIETETKVGIYIICSYTYSFLPMIDNDFLWIKVFKMKLV